MNREKEHGYFRRFATHLGPVFTPTRIGDAAMNDDSVSITVSITHTAAQWKRLADIIVQAAFVAAQEDQLTGLEHSDLIDFVAVIEREIGPAPTTLS